MNETVKAALLTERRNATRSLEICRSELKNVRSNLADAEDSVAHQTDRLADVEAFLRDNGVDLAAVDAEAEKARAKSGALSNGLLTQSYGQQISSMRDMANQQPNIMAGLAKALDEA